MANSTHVQKAVAIKCRHLSQSVEKMLRDTVGYLPKEDRESLWDISERLFYYAEEHAPRPTKIK